MDKTHFIKKLSDEIQRDNLAYFLGAGVSIKSGYSDWKSLMKDIAEELNLNIEIEDDMISIAQYYKNRHRSRSRLNQKITDEFGRKAEPNSLLSILCRLPVRSIWTTNYDDLIEREFDYIDRILDVKRRQIDLSISKPHRDATLYKIHGDITEPDKAVITRDDYESFDHTRGLFTKHLIGELISKTFVFVGYSFSDPNFIQILSKIRMSLLENKREHFYIVKKVTDEYERIKQKLKIDDLLEYGINTLEIDDYDEITDIFKEIRQVVYKDNVFISGSAHEYLEYSNEIEAKNLIKEIAHELIKNNYKVYSGYGLGVGEYVVEGIIKGLSEKAVIPNDPFTLKIFPQKTINEKSKNEMWKGLREDLISQCRTAIFVFGNKIQGDKVVLANGMLEEFEIAVSHNLRLIPIPTTGYMAKNLFNQNREICSIDETLISSFDNSLIIDSIKKLLKVRG